MQTPGLNHVILTISNLVKSREFYGDWLGFDLQDIADELIAAGVEIKGVETYHTENKYVAFRDPDNIQLEYWLPK